MILPLQTTCRCSHQECFKVTQLPLELINHDYIQPMFFYLSLYSKFLVLCNSFLNLSGGGYILAKIARWPDFSVRGVQCFGVSLLTNRAEQLGRVSGACVAYAGKMRLDRCCLRLGTCASVAGGFRAAVSSLMGV